MPAAAADGSLPTMITAVEAIYEGGQLRLLQPLALPEHTHVRLSVETLSGNPEHPPVASPASRGPMRAVPDFVAQQAAAGMTKFTKKEAETFDRWLAGEAE